MFNVAFAPHDRVRIGLVGVGSRGSSLLGNLLQLERAAVTAVHDVEPAALTAAADRVAAAGQPRPVEAATVDAVLDRDDVDLVLVATPWDDHTPTAVRAMSAGKHVAVEVPAALDVEDCWQLVRTSEATRRHCVMLENCCYGYHELLVLNLVRAGRLGELLHAEAAYLHDLRASLMGTSGWRRQSHVRFDGNLYPTHGLGPVASYLGINRGDRFASIVSMSSPSRGLDLWRERRPDASDASTAGEVYACGDINTSIISTERGRTIMLQHQVVGPRPYDRRNQVVGTDGVFSGYPPRIYLEDPNGPAAGADEAAEEWVGLEAFADYEHELWRADGERARTSGGHGGMDFLMLLRLVQTMHEGSVPDMDVYDAAAWSAPAGLSFASVAAGGAPMAFPDFTDGRWSEERPGIP